MLQHSQQKNYTWPPPLSTHNHTTHFPFRFNLKQNYIQKVPSFCDNLLRDSHKPYGPPTPVTWFRLLGTQKNTCTSNALSAETHWPACTLLRALSRFRLSNITCAWSWRHCEINPAIPSSSSQTSSALLARFYQWDFLNKRLFMYKNTLFIN